VAELPRRRPVQSSFGQVKRAIRLKVIRALRALKVIRAIKAIRVREHPKLIKPPSALKHP
jgi:hypothetical protein